MKKQFAYLLALGLIFFLGCQKEYSFETGGSPAEGTLTSDVTGDCLPKTINGVYEATVPLVPTTNTISVEVNVTKTGSYVITTDTVNGIYFRGNGTFTTLGPTSVTLRGNGTPFTEGIHNFVVRYGSSVCDIQVEVLPSGAGGPAVFTLENTAGNCTPGTVAGSYAVDIDLNASNTVTITVNVTTIGTYNITTTFQGMTFAKNGAFTSTGIKTVVLVGSGKPTTAGANIVPLNVGASSCSFTVNVGTAAQFTIDCPSVTVNGTYTAGVPLDGTNTVTMNVNVTTAGVYSITVGPTNGMTFSGSGNLSTGIQAITLTANNSTPTAAQTTTFTLPGPLCTFDVTVVAGATIDWSFTLNGAPNILYQGASDDAQLVPLGPFVSLVYFGSNAADNISISLVDVSGTIQNGETYSTSATMTNSASFAFIINSGADQLTAQPGLAGVTVTFNVTSHNVATKTIIGTFAGTVKDAANATRTISGGQFKAVYN